jgi:hypothetical protein
MKNWIDRIVGPTGRTLAAAGALGLASPASAQRTMELPAGPVGHVVPSPDISGPAEASDGFGRLAELRVELAWLSNPVTFPYHLGTHAEGMSLEVRGFVPNDAVREMAVKIARQQSGLNVVDKLQSHPGLVMRPVGRPTEELIAAAKAALAARLPDHASSLAVQAQRNGQLKVTGCVSSYELKLAVSEALRKVPGCSQVANDLMVSSLQKDGTSYTLVSADGTLMVPTGMLGHAPGEPSSVPSTPAATVVVPAPVQTVGTSLQALPLQSNPPASVLAPPSQGTATSSRLDAPRTTTTRAAIQEKLNQLLPSYSPAPVQERGLTNPTSTNPAKPAATTASIMTAAKPAEMATSTSSPGKSTEMAPGLPSLPKLAEKPTTAPSQAKPAGMAGNLTTSAKPAEITPSTISSTKPIPPVTNPAIAAPAQPTATKQPDVVMTAKAPPPGGYMTTGLLLIDGDDSDTGSPAKAKAPAATPVKSASTVTPPAKPRVMPTSTAKASAPPAPVAKPALAPAPPVMSKAPPAAPARSTGLDAGRLRQQIQATCGALAKNIEVVADSERSFTIRAKARTIEEGEKLSEKIFSMPELGPYQVSLDVQLVP